MDIPPIGAYGTSQTGAPVNNLPPLPPPTNNTPLGLAFNNAGFGLPTLTNLQETPPPPNNTPLGTPLPSNNTPQGLGALSELTDTPPSQ